MIDHCDIECHIEDRTALTHHIHFHLSRYTLEY